MRRIRDFFKGDEGQFILGLVGLAICVALVFPKGTGAAHDGSEHQEFKYCALGEFCGTPLDGPEQQHIEVQKGAGEDGSDTLNPNRDYYDAQGNRYSWDGKLIAPAPELPKTGGGCK